MADGDLDIDALLEGPIDQKQDRGKSQSAEVRESQCPTTAIVFLNEPRVLDVCYDDDVNANAGI